MRSGDRHTSATHKRHRFDAFLFVVGAVMHKSNACASTTYSKSMLPSKVATSCASIDSPPPTGPEAGDGSWPCHDSTTSKAHRRTMTTKAT
eukprot:6458406-Amphidinium_carterae.2